MEKRLIKLARDDGPALGMWEMFDPRAQLPPLLLVHGATYGAAIFDLDRKGYSLMRELAGHGRSVYALDVRGYGASVSTSVMNAAASDHPPYARASDAMHDIALATDYACERHAAEQIDVVGFSWGTITASMFAAQSPARIRRLGLYAPLFGQRNELWLDRIGETRNRSALASRYGAYRLVSLADTLQRWNEDLPSANTALFRDEGIAELLFYTQAALDPRARTAEPNSFRCPNGALADLIEVMSGRPMVDAAKLTMPTLLVRGAHDTTSTLADAQQFLKQIWHSGARYTEIPGGSHFLCVERNRHKLYEELQGFLER